MFIWPKADGHVEQWSNAASTEGARRCFAIKGATLLAMQSDYEVLDVKNNLGLKRWQGQKPFGERSL